MKNNIKEVAYTFFINITLDQLTDNNFIFNGIEYQIILAQKSDDKKWIIDCSEISDIKEILYAGNVYHGGYSNRNESNSINKLDEILRQIDIKVFDIADKLGQQEMKMLVDSTIQKLNKIKF